MKTLALNLIEVRFCVEEEEEWLPVSLSASKRGPILSKDALQHRINLPLPRGCEDA